MTIKNNKKRGAMIESKTKKLLESMGHIVIKTSVSDSNPDILSFYNNSMNLIEVKSIITDNYKELQKKLINQMKKYYEISKKLDNEMNLIDINIGLIIWFKEKNKWKYVMFIDNYNNYENVIYKTFDSLP